jgi:PEP-CTERM motif-containing protein
MKLRKLALPAAAAFAMTFAGAASAATLLTLLGPFDNTVGPQSASNPCIIAGTTCQQPDGFGYNNFKQTGNIFDYNMWSTTPTAQVDDGVQGTPYTVSQLNALGSSFVVAIDVNTATGGETLQLFEVWDTTTNTLLYNYVGPTNIATGINNGNGWGDWTLGNISFAGLASTDGILFHASWTGATDGAESFFLVPTTPAIPEPETYAMMLVGFSLLGFVARRRKQSLGNVVPV